MALKTTARIYPAKENFISQYELEETENMLKNLKSSQTKAASLIENWVEQRLKSIESVNSLEEKFSNCHQACNVGQGAGAAMEVVGSLAMVAGAILTVCGHKNVGEFLTKKVSPVSLGAGVATSVCSSLADAGITYSTLREVRKVMEADENCSQELRIIFKDSKGVDGHLRHIFNCSTLSDIFLDVVKLCHECIPLLEVGVNEFSKLEKILKSKLKGRGLNATDISDYTETIIENVKITMKNIANDRKARVAVKNICHIIQESPSSIEFIKLGLKLTIRMCDFLKVDAISSLFGFRILKTGAGVMATHCLLGSVLVAVNVLSVISAIKDVQGESSKYSKMLKELSKALTCELNTVRKKYLM